MITEGMVYWITRLDGLCNFCNEAAIVFFVLFIIAVIAACITYGFWKIEDDSEAEIIHKMTRKTIKIILPIWIIMLAGSLFIPTTKEAVAIYMIPKIAANEDVAKIPPKLAEFARKQLEEWIDDLNVSEPK